MTFIHKNYHTSQIIQSKPQFGRLHIANELFESYNWIIVFVVVCINIISLISRMRHTNKVYYNHIIIDDDKCGQ